jgi:hypothetical protein
MSLRTALAALPDDRATIHAVHEVIATFAAHPREPIDSHRMSRSTGIDEERIEPVLDSLVRAVVVDCDGDPSMQPCTFNPGPVLQLEVERFLRTSSTDAAHVHANIGRFRSRFGRD